MFSALYIRLDNFYPPGLLQAGRGSLFDISPCEWSFSCRFSKQSFLLLLYLSTVRRADQYFWFHCIIAFVSPRSRFVRKKQQEVALGRSWKDPSQQPSKPETAAGATEGSALNNLMNQAWHYLEWNAWEGGSHGLFWPERLNPEGPLKAFSKCKRQQLNQKEIIFYLTLASGESMTGSQEKILWDWEKIIQQHMGLSLERPVCHQEANSASPSCSVSVTGCHSLLRSQSGRSHRIPTSAMAVAGGGGQ